MIGSFERGWPQQSRRMVVAGVAAWLALYGCASTGTRTAADRTPAATQSRADAGAIRVDIDYLASDRLEGRGTGTAGNDSAAAYIARRFASLGLRRLDSSYEQHFVA